MNILLSSLRFVAMLATVLLFGLPVAADTVLSRLLPDVAASELVEGADAFGGMHPDIPVVQVLKAGERIGWAYITSDFVSTTGYSGKPIHTMVAIDDAAQVIGVERGPRRVGRSVGRLAGAARQECQDVPCKPSG